MAGNKRGPKPPFAAGDTAILVTTFLRDDCLFRCLESIRKYYPEIPVFVGDNGHHMKAKSRLVRFKFRAHYVGLPFDLGVGGVRNKSLEMVPGDFRFVAIVEDDIVFSEPEILEKLRAVLDAEPEAGLAGCILRDKAGKDQHYEAETWIAGGEHHIRAVSSPEMRTTPSGIRYFLCGLVLNVFLARREVLDEVRWDDRFKTAFEHSDWFLRLKYRQDTEMMVPEFGPDNNPIPRERPIRAAYCPDAALMHWLEEDALYKKYRRRPAGYSLFGEKWRVKLGYSSYNKRNPVPFFAFGGNMGAKDEALIKAVNIFERLKIRKWWLEAGTCLGAVRGGDFIAHDLDLDFGFPQIEILKWKRLIAEFKAEGFELYKEWLHGGKRMELSFTAGEIKVDLFFFFRRGDKLWHGAWGRDGRGGWGEKAVFLPHVFSADLFDDLKEIIFRNARCYVPNPPERYLEERYGKDWRTPNKAYKYWLDCRAVDRAWLKKERTVFIGGVWDLFHVGHLRILKRAAALGEKLVVGIVTDEGAERYKTARPVIPYAQRKEIVETLPFVSRTMEQRDMSPEADWEREGIIPDYIVHGDDWDYCPGDAWVRERGGKTVFLPHTPEVSSSAIRERIVASAAKVHGARAAEAMISKKETVAVVIKTYYREDALFKTVSALKKNFDVAFRLYIADDSRASDKKEALYSSLAREGHCILRLTADSGISFGRNAAVRALQGERLVLVMDDDIEIRESGVAEKLAAVLACRDDTGIAAGLLMSDAGGYFVCENYARGLDFQMADGLLRRVPAARNTEEAAGGVAYSIADQVPNFFLARREVFDSTLWDERIKVEYEHMDFFLSLKKAGRWRAVVCPDARAWHLRSIADDRYLIGRRSGSAVYFLQKWGLRRVFNSWGQ